MAARASVIFCVVAFLTACAPPAAYFSSGPEVMHKTGVTSGRGVYLPLRQLSAPGDKQVSLIQLSPLYLDQSVHYEAYVQDVEALDSAGQDERAAIQPDLLLPLHGATLEPGKTLQLVLQISAIPAGVRAVEFRSFALTFVVEGESQRTEVFSVGGKVWTCDDTSACPEPPSPPESTPAGASDGMSGG